MQREQVKAIARSSGRPILIPAGGSGGPTANPVKHDYIVRNAGQATITELYVWIDDEGGKVASKVSGGRVGLAPGESMSVSVEVPQPVPAAQILMVEWHDDIGEHTEPTGIWPPRHH